MWTLIYVAEKVARHTTDARLFSTLEKILVECSDLVSGYPTPPTWMSKLRPVIVGGGQYGWDDGTWIHVAHSIAEFLLDAGPRLPAEVSAEHTQRLSQATNHYIEKLESIRKRIGYQEPLERELNYWKSLKAKL
jgi:hypothetical protein